MLSSPYPAKVILLGAPKASQIQLPKKNCLETLEITLMGMTCNDLKWAFISKLLQPINIITRWRIPNRGI